MTGRPLCKASSQNAKAPLPLWGVTSGTHANCGGRRSGITLANAVSGSTQCSFAWVAIPPASITVLPASIENRLVRCALRLEDGQQGETRTTEPESASKCDRITSQRDEKSSPKQFLFHPSRRGISPSSKSKGPAISRLAQSQPQTSVLFPAFRYPKVVIQPSSKHIPIPSSQAVPGVSCLRLYAAHIVAGAGGAGKVRANWGADWESSAIGLIRVATDVIATLPMLAAFFDQPLLRASPYHQPARLYGTNSISMSSEFPKFAHTGPHKKRLPTPQLSGPPLRSAAITLVDLPCQMSARRQHPRNFSWFFAS